MKKQILSVLTLLFALPAVFAQDTTNYQEVPLESTPITVVDRKKDNTINSAVPIDAPKANLASGSGGNAISETSGALSVSLTGGAVYTVPIKVPPGINGVTPTIALAYNSQGGNGLAGYGWNVTGISVISRIASTKYHDNNIDPVDFDNLDRFALDGQRLILKSGSYGADNATYETENYSNLKITSLGTSAYGAAYGPASFKVEYPDGSIGYYGSNSNSQSRTDYAITYWQNPKGVLVEYSYVTSDNSLSISTIKYGHRTGLTAPNTISFVYKARKRSEQSFIGGIDFRRKTILSELNVATGVVGYRRYLLSHTSNTLGYERLAQITEKSGDNTLVYAPVTFSYSDTSPSLGYGEATTSLSLSGIEQRNATLVPLDANGDGKMDFIVYPNTRTERTKVWLFQNIVSGSTTIGSTINIPSIYEQVFPVSYLLSNNKLAGNQGFCTVSKSTTNTVAFRVNGPNGVGGYSQQYEKSWAAPMMFTATNCDVSSTNLVPRDYLSGDFNGDGLSDVVAINRPYVNRYCSVDTTSPGCTGGGGGGGGGPQPIMRQPADSTALSAQLPNPETTASATSGCCSCSNSNITTSGAYFINLDRRLSSGFANFSGNLTVALASNDRLVTADVNGDGRTDILHFAAGKVYAYTLTISNTLQLLWTSTDTRIKNEFLPLLGDYNGDGKTDFMLPTANGSTTFALFLSTGTAFVKRESVYPFTFRTYSTGTSPINSFDLIPSDINGDGRTDILEYSTVTTNGSTNGTQTLKMYFNTFSTVTDVTPAFTYITSATKTGNLAHLPIPAFLNYDKPNDNFDFVTISNKWLTPFSFGKDNRKDMQLTGILNDGITQTITYRDMVDTEKGLDNIQVYYPLQEQIYPFTDIPVSRGVKLVAALTRTVSGTTSIRQVFSYQGAVSHAEGLGFLGFTGIGRSEWNTGDTDRIWNISKQDVANRGATISSYSLPYTLNFNHLSIPSDYITKTSYVNASSISGSKVFKLTNTSNVTQNRLQGTAITTSYLYDTYTNPTKVTVDYSGQGSSITDITYGNSTGTPYYIGRPLTKKQTTTINGNPFSSEEIYTYDGYQLWKLDTKGNGATTVDNETYLYDAFGNILKKSTTPYGMSTRNVNFTYDTSGRYLLTSKDIEDLTTTFEYNPTGTLKKETNPYALSTQYFYDAWDRLTKVTDYLGKSANTVYTKSGNNYTVTATADDGGGSITVYDALKRVITSSQKDVLGQWVSKSYQYDKFDRPYRESEPYIGGSATQWNTTDYDFFGRVNKITSFTGKVTNISYTNQSVSVNDGTKTVVTTKNALGNVTQVTDPGGAITYTYYGNGAMKNSTFGGITISMEQDAWGRKTKLIDPSAGTYSYEYNRFGEMTKEITPKGNTLYAYSPLGKLNTKTVTGDASTNMVINYTYDPVTKLPKTIALVTNNDGNTGTTTFNYDSYKRVSSTVENSTYTTFTKTFAYDAFGRVDSEESKAQLGTKTSTVKVKNTYAYGQLKNVNDFTTSEELWNVTGLNARGQVTTSTMGAAMKRTNSYDTFGYLTQALSQRNVTSTPLDVMKLNFSFNTQRGTLTNRTNGLFAWTESFTYDAQDRLLTFNDANSAKSHTYDTKNRIDVNSQIGQYKYSSTNFQQTELILNTTGQTYYNGYTAQNITYNSFKSPTQISEAGKETLNFQYNAALGRATMFYGDTNADRTLRPFRKHYSSDGSMEIKWEKATGKATFVTYIGGDGYSSPVMYHSEQGSSTVNQYLYLHRDYLGSILAITDKSGNLKEKRHFDAWGNIVKLTDGNNIALTKFAILDRGYTGHEHLQGVGLVHMNGRLYDPMLHRFLMPDNFVQDPYNTLSYNRYAYAMYNPLMYTDANGEFWHIVIGAVIGGIVNWATHGFKFNAQGLGYFAVGAVAGALTAAIGAGVSSSLANGSFTAGFLGTSAAATATTSFATGAAIGASSGLAGGLVSGTGNGLVDGQNIGAALVNGIKTGGIGALSGGVLGGIAGGVDAALDGRRFFDGATVVKSTATPSYVLPSGQQSLDRSCSAEAGSIIDRSLGGSMTEDDVMKMIPGYDYANKGSEDVYFWKEFANKTGRGFTNTRGNLSAQNFYENFRNGSGNNVRFALSTNNHSLVLQSVTKSTITKISGNMFTRYSYGVMDPAHGALRNISPSKILNAFGIRN